MGLWMASPLGEVGRGGGSWWWVCWNGGVVTLGDVLPCVVVGFEDLLSQVEVDVEAVVDVVVAVGNAEQSC